MSHRAVEREMCVKSPGIRSRCSGNVNFPFLFPGTVFLGWFLRGPKHLPLPKERQVAARCFQGGLGVACLCSWAACGPLSAGLSFQCCLGSP